MLKTSGTKRGSSGAQGDRKSPSKRIKASGSSQEEALNVSSRALPLASSPPVRAAAPLVTSSSIQDPLPQNAVSSDSTAAVLPTPSTTRQDANTDTNIPMSIRSQFTESVGMKHSSGKTVATSEQGTNNSLAMDREQSNDNEGAEGMKSMLQSGQPARHLSNKTCWKRYLQLAVTVWSMLMIGMHHSSFLPSFPSLDYGFNHSNTRPTESPMVLIKSSVRSVNLDGTRRRYRRAPSGSSRHPFVTIDNQERQTSILTKVEKDLARVLNELSDSRNDAAMARQEATKAVDDYLVVVSQVEQQNQELREEQRRLSLLIQELDHTRQKLELTKLELTFTTMNLETVLEQLDEADEHIDELYHMLEVQETVAVHALNFVATTAVTQQQEAAVHTLNFVTTLAMKYKLGEIEIPIENTCEKKDESLRAIAG